MPILIFCRFWSLFTVFTKNVLDKKMCTCTNLGYISYWLQSKIRLGYMQWEKMKNLTFTNEKICSILQNCFYTLSANSLCFFNINLESAKKKGPIYFEFEKLPRFSFNLDAVAPLISCLFYVKIFCDSVFYGPTSRKLQRCMVLAKPKRAEFFVSISIGRK